MNTKAGHRRVWIDHTSELEASAASVSALLGNVEDWPSWSPGLRAIYKRGPLRVGSWFVMMIKPQGAPLSPVPCQLLACEPNLIEWGGGGAGGEVRHRFEIQSLGPNRCRVRQYEYATGWLAVLTSPIAKIAGRHDLAWSRELERRFARSAVQTSAAAS
ncbi:MAG: Polyketide cyclase / dehydrase and lipid transport [Pseudomonadota bacterium]